MHAIVYHHAQCDSCLRARQVENARLAWKDLYNLRNANRANMNFIALAAYGAVHFNSLALCFACQDRSTRLQSSNSQ